MSDLTPEGLRAAAFRTVADWVSETSNYGDHYDVPGDLRAEADRLETESKTLGQVLCEEIGDVWATTGRSNRREYERVAAAVIAHREAQKEMTR